MALRNRLGPNTILWALTNIGLAGSAFGQAQTISPADQLEQIVVTATKRDTTVQNTPISITAISGADIETRGVADFDSLARSIPGVSMDTAGPGQTIFEMRGVAAVGGNSSTVGFYLDDTPITTSTLVVIDPNLYDLNRVEVLRGPQGTLYGAGSMGGTIKLVPNAPNPQALDASAETSLSHTDGGDNLNHSENAMVNLPFAGGTAALRIVGSQEHESGWIDRIVIAEPDFPLETNNVSKRGNVLATPVAANYRDVNDEDLTGVRVAVIWKPTDNLAITPSYFYQQIRQNGLTAIDSDPGTNAHYQPFDTPEPYSDRFNLASVNLKYRFDTFDVISTTSRLYRDQTLRQDGNENFQWALSTPTAIFPFYTSQGGIGPVDPTGLLNFISKQTTEELRAVSTGSSPFQWLIGYYYSDASDVGAIVDLAPGAAPLFGTANLFTNSYPTKLIQNSLFSELSYQLTPELKGTVGLRRYYYTESVGDASSGVFSPTGSDAYSHTAARARDQGVNPKFNLAYEMDQNLLLYVTIAKGFRPGGGNFTIPTSGSTLGNACEAELQANAGTTAFVAAPSSFGPDSIWSYELGEKATLLDRHLTIDSAVYFENWSGVQQNVGLACGFAYTANAGDAHIYGAETEVTVLLTQGLILTANAGYTHARIVEGLPGTGITPGEPVQNIPGLTSSVSLAYRHGLADNLAFTWRIENNYVAGHYDVTSELNHLPAYDLTNFRMGLESGRWAAILFAKNLLNKRALLTDTNQGNVSLNIPTFNRVAVSQPLTLGLDLSYHFGR
jgi:iron complex outermembrane receptor protein